MAIDMRNHYMRWALGDDSEDEKHLAVCGAPEHGFMALRHVTCMDCLKVINTYCFVRLVELGERPTT